MRPEAPNFRMHARFLMLALAVLFIPPSAYAQDKAESSDTEKIYTIRELAKILKDSPAALKGKKIKLQAFTVDYVKGIGWDSEAILIDHRDLQAYKKAYRGLIGAKDRQAARKQLAAIPTISTGPTMGFGTEFSLSASPSLHGIYEAHFFDPSWTEHWKQDGYKRVFLERKIKDLTTQADKDAIR